MDGGRNDQPERRTCARGTGRIIEPVRFWIFDATKPHLIFQAFIFLHSQEVISLKVRTFPYKTIIFYFINQQKIIQELGDPSYFKVVNAAFWKGHHYWYAYYEGIGWRIHQKLCLPTAKSLKREGVCVCVCLCLCVCVMHIGRHSYCKILVIVSSLCVCILGKRILKHFGGWESFCTSMQGCSNIKHHI